MPNPSQTAAASFWPGLQNVGQTSGTALISGTLNASPSGISSTSSNMTGSIFVGLPNASVISGMRLNLPDAHGHLASRWFPLFGCLELTDATAQWKVIFNATAAAGGRGIYFNFVNIANGTTTFTNFRVNIVAHLYSYPW